MNDRQKSKIVYGGRIPGDYLPAHNHVIHTPQFVHGDNGFRRFWIPPEFVESGRFAKCPCGWRGGRKWSEPGEHYAACGHVEWWGEEIEKRGSLKAVYQSIERRLAEADDLP
jgi:hypothetical protein